MDSLDWKTILAIAAINIGLIAWLRADMRDFHSAMKDFHGRLCKLEEKYQQLMQRYWEKK